MNIIQKLGILGGQLKIRVTDEDILEYSIQTGRINKIRYNKDIPNAKMAKILEKHLEFLLVQEVITKVEKENALERINNKFKTASIHSIGAERIE